MSRSRLESYKCLVSVSSRLVKPTSRSRLGLISVSGGERLGLVSVSSFYVSCPSLATKTIKRNVMIYLFISEITMVCDVVRKQTRD